jgi:hypothetical protein
VIGKSGLDHLGTFCYLHDPLAMWVALKRADSSFKKWWSEAHVTMDITHGPGRGRMIQHSGEKAKSIRSRAEVLGTKVLWLDPVRFDETLRKRFVGDVKKLLGLSSSIKQKAM